MSTTLASETAVLVSRGDFDRMLSFAVNMHRLKFSDAYLQALDAKLPEAARVIPSTPSVLMGYDFHLTETGPKLIEINNNAGGLYIGDGRWIPQPEIPELDGSLEARLVGMFPAAWKRIVIMDEAIESQFMLPEMRAYAELLRADGREVWLLSPEDLEAGSDGLYAEGERIDAIYNRHTDFYLESGALAHIRRAYEAGSVALSPNPRSYALIGDKARMVDWWHPGVLEHAVAADAMAMIREIVPEIHLFSEMDEEMLWQSRNNWVFKPAARHGGKGVLLGKSISRKRFGELETDSTVVQQYVPASTITIDEQEFKLDLRLFMHGEKLIAVAGRAWQGQVTNFRAEGSGWVPLAIG